MGIFDQLSGLFGGSAGPVATQDGQVVGPLGGLQGLFDRLGTASPALMGFGMGMLSGGNQQEGFGNALQGMQSGQQQMQRAALLKRQQDRQNAEDSARMTLAQKLGLDPAVAKIPTIADSQISERMNPDKGQIIGDDRLGYWKLMKDGTKVPILGPAPEKKDFTERQYDLLSPADQEAYRRSKFMPQPQEYDPSKVYGTPDGKGGFIPMTGLPQGQKPAPQGYRWNSAGTALEPIPGGPATARDVPSGYRVSGDGTKLEPIPGGPADKGPQNNPYNNGKMTESEGNSAVYADRMATAHKVLTDHESINEGFTGTAGAAASALGAPNLVKSDERKQVEQAQRNFVTALLRRESGAAIGKDEFDEARKLYFPQPGDDAQTIAQKRQAREQATSGFMRSAGAAYTPPPDWKDGVVPKYGKDNAQPKELGGTGMEPGSSVKVPGAKITRVR